MASSTRPAWVEYEVLAHQIVQELAPLATVTYDDHVLGKESQARRQIDISVRWKDGDVENLLIVQVKDLKRKANINTVGEFRAVIQDVRAQKGILICSGGFSKNAVTYARNIGVLLWSLADARSKRWASELTIPTLWNRVTPIVRMSLKFETNSAPLTTRRREDGALDLWDDEGETPFDLTAAFEARWTTGRLNLEPGVEHPFPIDKRLFLRGVRGDGVFELLALFEVSIMYTVSRDSYLAQLLPSDYRGIIDHLAEGEFVPSHLDLAIPSLNDSTWTLIPEPARLAVNMRGSFITIEDSRIRNPRWEGLSLARIGDAG